MQKKYHFYVSSASGDLKSERSEIIRIIIELGAIPISMDGFDIENEEDRRFIKKAIEESDYFINLTAYKGGIPIANSFALELEYTWAVKARVPVFAFIISDTARWKDSKKEKDPALLKSIEEFKSRLKNHAHDNWLNIGDLRHKTLALITRELNLRPRRGWVPSTELMDSSVANEMAKLIRDNEVFRSRLRMEGTDIVKKIREQMRQALRVMTGNRVTLSFYYIDSENWENTRAFSYIKLFRLLVPEMSSPKTANEISHFLGNILNPDMEKTVRKDFPTPSNSIKKIMTDLTLLKLVRSHGTGDHEVWEMTEYGRETFATYRLRQMNRNLQRRAAQREEAAAAE